MCLSHFDLGPSPSKFTCVEEMCIVLELYETHKITPKLTLLF